MKIFDCGVKQHSLKKTSSPKRTRPFWRKRDGMDVFIQVLENALDNRFTLLCNLSLPELSEPAPLILVGPPGIHVVLPSSAKGVFRASEEAWEEMDERGRGYKAARQNPMMLVAKLAAAVQEHFTRIEIEAPQIEPVLFFSEPGAHVESSKPIVRIILADGLLRFAGSLIQGRVILDKGEIQNLIDALVGGSLEEMSRKVVEKPDAYTLREPPPPKKPRPPSRLVAISREEPEGIKQISKFFLFTRKQWVLLGLLFLACLIVLIALVMVVLISA